MRLIWHNPTSHVFAHPCEFGMVFLCDSQRLVSSGADGILRLWDARTAKLLAESHNISGGAAYIAAAREVPRLLVISDNGMVGLYDVEKDFHLLVSFPTELQRAMTRMSYHGRYYARVETSKQTHEGGASEVLVRSTGTNEVVFSHPGLSFALGRSTIALPTERGVGIWDFLSGQFEEVVLPFFSQSVSHSASQPPEWFYRASPAQFSSTEELLAVNCRDSILVWSRAARKMLYEIGKQGRVLGFLPDGSGLVCEFGSESEFNSIAIWRFERSEPDQVFSCLSGNIMSPDGRLCAARGFEGISIHSLESGEDLHRDRTAHSGPVRAVHVLKGRDTCVTADASGLVLTMDAEGRIREYHDFFPRTVYDTWPSGHDDTLAVLVETTLLSWNLRTDHVEEMFTFQPGSKSPLCLLVGSMFVWNNGHSSLMFTDLNDPGRSTEEVFMNAPELFAVAYHEPRRLIAAAAFDPDCGEFTPPPGIHLFYQPGHQEWRFIMHEQKEPITTLDFSLDGRLLASGDGQSNAYIWEPGSELCLWEVDSGRCIRAWSGHGYVVRCVRFSPDGSRLASTGSDGAVRLWDVENGKLLESFEPGLGELTCLAFWHDGTKLVVGGLRGDVMILGLD